MGEGKMRGERKEQETYAAPRNGKREREREEQERERKRKKGRKNRGGRSVASGVTSTWNDCRCSYFKRRVKQLRFFFFSSSSTLSVRVVNALTLCARTIVRFVRVSCLFSCLAFVCCAARVQVYLGRGGTMGGEGKRKGK